MTSTTFVDKTTLIEAPWLNDVDALVYQGQLDDGTTGAAISQYLPAGAGAVARTVQTKLRESVSVKDFGAVGDGVTDDTAEVQAAIDSGALSIYLPTGTYLCGVLTLANNVCLHGDGLGSILKVKNSIGTDFLVITGKTGVRLRDFKIDGNEANQTAGNVIFGTGVNDLECNNITVVDPYRWAFAFYGSSDNLRFHACHSVNGRAGADANSVVAGFLFGASGTSSPATNVFVEGCSSVSTASFRNGFMSDYGSQHQFVGCRSSVGYTGFKLRCNQTTVTGCFATSGTQGFQTQADILGLTLTGNTAYRCGDSGFFFAILSGTAISWVISGNNAIENGQTPLSSSYGFNFDPTAGATIDGLTFTGNSAVDAQGVKTQARGFSFGVNGTISDVMFGNNSAIGNTVDCIFGAALQKTTLLKTFNRATTGSSSIPTGYPTAVHRLTFWTDNLIASSGTVTLSSGFGGRGYMMPKAGFIRLISAKGNATTTAGNATFQLRINGTVNSSFNSQINTTNPTLVTTEVALFSNVFAAGDMITVSVVGDAAFAPSGTTDFDVVVEVCY